MDDEEAAKIAQIIRKQRGCGAEEFARLMIKHFDAKEEYCARSAWRAVLSALPDLAVGTGRPIAAGEFAARCREMDS